MNEHVYCSHPFFFCFWFCFCFVSKKKRTTRLFAYIIPITNKCLNHFQILNYKIYGLDDNKQPVHTIQKFPIPFVCSLFTLHLLLHILPSLFLYIFIFLLSLFLDLLLLLCKVSSSSSFSFFFFNLPSANSK